MSKQDLEQALENSHPFFRADVLRIWDNAEQYGYPLQYLADAGSVAINGIHFSNGIGDGKYFVSVIYSDEAGYSPSEWTNTGAFFYSDQDIKIDIYDCFPETAFTCRFKREFIYAEIYFDRNGNLIIFCHV